MADNRRDAWDKSLSWTHDERAQRRAREIAAKLLRTRPRQPFSKVASSCRFLTADIAPRVVGWLSCWIGEQLAETLTEGWPYRRATSSWAGGEHNIEVTLGPEPEAACESTRVWSSNGKWSGTNSDATLCITPRCYEALGNGVVVGGLVTLDCEEVAPREYRATWAEQAKGFQLKAVAGWIIRGYHVVAPSLEMAQRKADKARRDRLATLQVDKLKLGQVDLQHIYVTRADSLRAGNCSAGTSSFINAHSDVLGGKTRIRADELLRLADDVYTRATVLRAVARTLAEGRLDGYRLTEEAREASS